MATFSRGFVALAVTAGAALLTGCSASHSIGTPDEVTSSARRISPQTSAYQLLHRFDRHPKSGPDHGGAQPDSGLVDVNGVLYGTTEAGGSRNRGTVYSISPMGVKKTLYRFGSQAGDGRDPVGDLVNVNGTLYGVTYCAGGSYCGHGTIYNVTTAGVEKVLHTLSNAEGSEPEAGLVNVNGTLYGTTTTGGEGAGTVYSITTDGYFKVIYAFGQVYHDALAPASPLLNVDGTLYGTSQAGGEYCRASCGGTVFSVTPSGTEKVVFSFIGSNGASPISGLIEVNGTLYGTTEHGGSYSGCQELGCGVVYSITTAGQEQVLHTFTSGDDGAYPAASLVAVNGVLYGTTRIGGSANSGTVFAIGISGGEQILHSFGSSRGDGTDPQADLTEVNGAFYGTTFKGGIRGGCSGAGCGTVFALSP